MQAQVNSVVKITQKVMSKIVITFVKNVIITITNYFFMKSNWLQITNYFS